MNDPATHKMGSLLNNYADKSFLGERIETKVARAIAEGDLDPNSLKYYKDFVKKIALKGGLTKNNGNNSGWVRKIDKFFPKKQAASQEEVIT